MKPSARTFSVLSPTRNRPTFPLILTLVLVLHVGSHYISAAAQGGYLMRGFKGPSAISIRSPMTKTHHYDGHPWYLNKIQSSSNNFLMNWTLLHRMSVLRPIRREKKALGTLTKLYPNFWSRAIMSSTKAPATAARESRVSHLVDNSYDHMFPLGLGSLGRRPTGMRLRWG